MDYRFVGKRLTMSFGAYPEIGLAEARDGRDAARKQLANGPNPLAERRVAKSTAQLVRANTFSLIADELLARLEGERKADVAIDKRRWLPKELAQPLRKAVGFANPARHPGSDPLTRMG
jgi:hypothetical protein